MTPRHRKIQVALLLAGVGLLICLTGQIFVSRYYPAWRQRAIREAFDHDAVPASWWLPGWRQEYERHVKLAEELAERHGGRSLQNL